MVGNPNIIARKAALKTGKSEVYYAKLIEFIFNEIEDNLQTNSVLGVFLRNVGTWRVDGNVLRYYIYKTIKEIRKYKDRKDIKGINNYNYYLERLRYLLKIRNELAIYYNKYKKPYNEKKYQTKVEQAKEHHRRMEELYIGKE